MSPVFTVLAASATTFAATNVDDLFLLTMFFARRVATRRIVAGQYFGFAAIVMVSLAGVWAAGAAVPQGWIRLLGIFPLAIGVKALVKLHHSKSTRAAERHGSLSVFSIAVITLANGGDNIGVYLPFFVAGRSHLWLVLATYGLFVLVWCASGKWLGSHPLILKTLDRWGHWIGPFVLIGWAVTFSCSRHADVLDRVKKT
jgi:cadmium resistance protein CadD (predicted permease)